MTLLEHARLYDHRTFNWCQRQRCHQRVVHISRHVSTSADGHLYLLAGLGCLMAGLGHFVIIMAAAFILERTVYYVLKTHVRRNRPPEAIAGFSSLIQAGDKFSFPSGHTSAAFLTATLFSLEFAAPVVELLLFPWACCVGYSRVILGVHFPADTVAGAALGSTIAAICWVAAGGAL